MTTSQQPSDSVVQMQAASVSYGGAPIVVDATLTIRRGELVVILGENGSGKSTLVKGMVGLAPLTHGSVRLFDESVSAAARHRVGYVPQRTLTSSSVPVTVRELVASGRVARRRMLRPMTAHDRAAIDQALRAVRLQDRARSVVATLSGGQQRRAMIARALAGEPELLIMDEPTAGVDTANVELLAESIKRWKGEGLTILVVAHGTGPLKPLIDRAVVMKSGRIVYDGPLSGSITTEHSDHVIDDHPDTVTGSFARPNELHWGGSR